MDRVGEINHIERTLRSGLARHPDAVVVANCDDVLMTSAAYDCPNVVWVAAGGGWANDSVSCPRSGEIIVRDSAGWYSTGTDFKRPTPQWWYDDSNIHGPEGFSIPMRLSLPGMVNRGNATQAVAAAVTLGRRLPPPSQPCRTSTRLRAGTAPFRWAGTQLEYCWPRTRRVAGGAVDGRHVRPGRRHQRQRTGSRREDLSWLWDVNFEAFRPHRWSPRANGEPIWRSVSDTPMYRTRWYTTRLTPSPPAPRARQVVANYTAFLSLTRTLGRMR